jgi:thiamine kinase-like enzyme
MTIPTVEQLERSIPDWAGRRIAVSPLTGGITNRNYVVVVDGRRFVARVPGERTELLAISRVHEAEAARRAAELGIAPPVVGELADVGTLITEMVGGMHLEPDSFVERLDEVVSILRRFHDSGPIGGTFPIHRVVEWHARDAARFGVEPPSAYQRLHDVSERIESVFASAPSSPAPCHNDLLPGNVLFDGDRVWLLDFEYAGMNDRFFDLANLSVNCGLTADADERLLRLYFGQVTSSGWARLQLMKVMSELREGMWAVVQQAISTLDTDFVAYADERLENCERLAASPEFTDWLGDAAAQP